MKFEEIENLSEEQINSLYDDIIELSWAWCTRCSAGNSGCEPKSGSQPFAYNYCFYETVRYGASSSLFCPINDYVYVCVR